MTRFPYDQFSKNYLEELLQPLGTVQVARQVAGARLNRQILGRQLFMVTQSDKVDSVINCW
jgi:hypothetical protein